MVYDILYTTGLPSSLKSFWGTLRSRYDDDYEEK